MEIPQAFPTPNTLAPEIEETNAPPTTPRDPIEADISASLNRVSQTGDSIETGGNGTRAASSTDAPVSLSVIGVSGDSDAYRLRMTSGEGQASETLPGTAAAGQPTNTELTRLRNTLEAIKRQMPDRLSKEWTQLFLTTHNASSPLHPKTLGVFFDFIKDFPRNKQEKDAKSSMIATEKVLTELVSPKGDPIDEGTTESRVRDFFRNIHDKAINLETANYILSFASNKIEDRPKTSVALISGLWGKYNAVESEFAPDFAARIVAFELSLTPPTDRYKVWKHALDKVGQSNAFFSPIYMSRFVNALSSNPPDQSGDIASAHADIAKILYDYPTAFSLENDQIRRSALEGFLKGVESEDTRVFVTELLASHLDPTTLSGTRWKTAILTVTNNVSELFSAENKAKIRDTLKTLAGA
ncbi:hypothetical protein PAQ31011_04065 [Pandoraea aquatica]|uniref:Uncharacterized protein n=2 Tax=Pandoraea aquatica TaxID=2508290 RepID=A0A5E4XR02_9BURK|nr:hypothetical protein PAQ31011_04065 [Pandoraea aquatica]